MSSDDDVRIFKDMFRKQITLSLSPNTKLSLASSSDIVISASKVKRFHSGRKPCCPKCASSVISAVHGFLYFPIQALNPVGFSALASKLKTILLPFVTGKGA